MAITDTTASTSGYDQTLKNLGITRSGTAATPNVSTTGTKTTLDQTDFLALMTAQMKNQDPFAPVDNTQMVAQMAQFSQVAGVSEMNKTLSGIATRLGATSSSDAMAYVGRTVLTAGNTAYERSAGGIAGAVELGADATDVNVSIADSSGKVVRTLQLGTQKAGTATYDWDGTDAAGNKVESGPYNVTVEASNKSSIVSATSLVWAPVESVSLPTNGTPSLNVTGLGTVDPSAIRKVA
jgi:flagellar basal-body rod modification protein FlgD